MNRRTVLSFAGVTLVLFAIAGSALLHPAAQAKDAPGCEGLGDYRTAMFKVGKAFVEKSAKDGIPLNRGIETFSSAEWKTKADDLAAYQAALKKVTPPSWLSQWHEVRVEGAGLGEQVALAASKDGLLAVLAFKDASAKIDAANTAAVAAATAACSDFPAFAHDWDALDGDINGTPVATPSS